MFDIGEHGPQPAPDHMGCFAAELVIGLDRAEVGFCRQLAGEQQQQLAQLQGEAATQQVGFEAGQAVQGQQQLLLQHPFPSILTAEAANHGGDGAAALGLGDQRLVGVITADHHLLLPHQQVREGVFQLGMHQAHGSCHPPHHTPIGFGQAAAVKLFQQGHQAHRCSAEGALQAGIGPQAAPQQLQHLGLLRQGGALPETGHQGGHRNVLQLLFLARRQGLLVGAGWQQGVPLGPKAAGGDRVGGQVDPAGLGPKILGAGESHRHPLQLSLAQPAAQFEKGFRIAFKRCLGHRNQQNR